MSSIDYGMGRTNIDRETGIRYGVIPANDLGESWFDSAVPDYGDPTCPKCGNTVVEYDDDQHGECEIGHVFSSYSRNTCADYACETCKIVLASDDCFGDEPIALLYTNDEYQAEQSGNGHDVFVTRSPFYTFAPFCSPCAPGAGYLPDAIATDKNLSIAQLDYPKVYCFGHDWFDDNKAPYRVFRVADDSEVFPV